MPKTKIEIIYTDDDFIVINKPGGVSVTKDRTGAAELRDILAGQLGADTAKRLRLVHRLDKHTSGVMILALNEEAQSRFSSYFEKRLIKKTYLALVTGVAGGPQGSINAHIIRDSKRPGQMHLSRKRGKAAVTEWKLLADFGLAALLAVYPLTGRTHQIRVHLPSIGLPLAIDPLYGSRKPLFLSDFKQNYRVGKERKERPLIDRLTLHAYQIEMLKPERDCPEIFVAGLDKKFKAAIKMLTKHNPAGLDAYANPDDFARIINTQQLD